MGPWKRGWPLGLDRLVLAGVGGYKRLTWARVRGCFGRDP